MPIDADSQRGGVRVPLHVVISKNCNSGQETRVFFFERFFVLRHSLKLMIPLSVKSSIEVVGRESRRLSHR